MISTGSLPFVNSVGDRLAGDPVALVLEPMDLDPVRRDALEALELLERARRSPRTACTMISVCVARGLGRRVDLVEDAGVGDLLDEVEDVVEAADQLVDVLAIERRDEGVLQLLADVVAEAVALALEVAQLAREPLALVVGAEELLEQPSTGQDVVGVLDEELEELLLARNERKAHGAWDSVMRRDPMAPPPLATPRSVLVRCHGGAGGGIYDACQYG